MSQMINRERNLYVSPRNQLQKSNILQMTAGPGTQDTAGLPLEIFKTSPIMVEKFSLRRAKDCTTVQTKAGPGIKDTK